MFLYYRYGKIAAYGFRACPVDFVSVNTTQMYAIGMLLLVCYTVIQINLVDHQSLF